MKTDTPTTELRIEGIIKAANKRAADEAFNYYFKSWSGVCTIVPNPDPTGMSLYKVEEVDGYKQMIETLEQHIIKIQDRETENDATIFNLTAQLEQKEKEIERQKVNYKWLFNKGENLAREIIAKNSEIAAKDLKIKSLETKLRLKENTRWKTFIKWVKEKVWNR